MSTRIFISGGYFHATDFRYLPGAAELEFDAGNPGLTVIKDIQDFISRASRADLCIFLTHGVKLERFFKQYGDRSEVREFFANQAVRKVAWSVDAHHLWPAEVAHQQYFDRMYVADTSVMPHYDQAKVAWLPCYYRYLSIDSLIETVRQPRRLDRGLVFPHHTYAIGDRNRIARQIKRFCDLKPMDNLFGNVGLEDTYKEMMLTSRICLNISLLSEVNLRTFEALAYNRVLLADECPDYGRIEADWSSTVFYHRHLGGFADRFDAAAAIAPESVNTMPSVVNRHMLSHRYLSIINQELGTGYKMDAVLPEGKVGKPGDFGNCLPAPASPTWREKLLARFA